MVKRNDPARCSSSDRVVHLSVVEAGDHDPPRKPVIAKSKMSRRRAIVLISIQTLIIVHIVLWLAGAFGGTTLTPVEPSEAMQTLEYGFINAGFIIFVLALLSTLIFGRFFCGWGCHIVMLQDFCGWIMKKCGVRPKPFRSRVLIWVPLLIALYMFVWPNFKRWAVFPILDAIVPGARANLASVGEWQGLSNHLVSEHFWTNPETGVAFPLIMAIPTLLIVGFAAVYFLGAKGFCTYGCPYGGFFAPLDEWSPARIRVNDNCEQCGHCTATCTSNVRVHEEVREYGMVVDPGCMKCMDCISVCPNDALYYGFGKPAVRKGNAKSKEPRRQFDLSLREDLTLGCVFLLTLLCVSGLYLGEAVPFLMAVGFAALFAFLTFKVWRTLRRQDEVVRIQNLVLKWRGRIRPAGWAVLAAAILVTPVLAMNGVANFSHWRAERLMDEEVTAYAQAPAVVQRPEHVITAAAAALVHMRRTLSVTDGGFALVTSPVMLAKLAAVHGVHADFDDAASAMKRAIEIGGEVDHRCATYASFLYLDGRGREGAEYAKDIAARHPEFESTFDTCVFLLEQVDGLDEAAAFARCVFETDRSNHFAARAHAELLLKQGSKDEALAVARDTLDRHPKDLRLHIAVAACSFEMRRFDDARRTLEDAIDIFPNEPELHGRLSVILRFLGDEEGAAAHAEKARTLAARRRSR